MIVFREDEVDEMERRYRAGETLVAVARSFGASHMTVRKRLIARGVPMRGAVRDAARSRGVDVEAAVRRYDAGETLESLARSVGLSRSTVRGLLRARRAAIRGLPFAGRARAAESGP